MTIGLSLFDKKAWVPLKLQGSGLTRFQWRLFHVETIWYRWTKGNEVSHPSRSIGLVIGAKSAPRHISLPFPTHQLITAINQLLDHLCRHRPIKNYRIPMPLVHMKPRNNRGIYHPPMCRPPRRVFDIDKNPIASWNHKYKNLLIFHTSIDHRVISKRAIFKNPI